MSKLDVRKAITDRGMTIADFCRKHDLKSQNLIQNVINGNPTVLKLQGIAEMLECDITDLFYPSADEEQPVTTETEEQTATVQEAEPVQTTAFCPHCGAKVRVGVVLIAD